MIPVRLAATWLYYKQPDSLPPHTCLPSCLLRLNVVLKGFVEQVPGLVADPQALPSFTLTTSLEPPARVSTVGLWLLQGRLMSHPAHQASWLQFLLLHANPAK